MNTLKAEKRDMSIKAKRLRREGFVTGSVFGRELKDSIPLKMVKKDAENLLKSSGRGSTIILDVEGEKMHVLIKEVDYNSLKKEVDEIEFQALVQNEMVNSVAEIVLLNHEKVTEGVLEQHLKEISYRALPAALVEKVEIDVGNMRVGDSIYVKDLPIASNKAVHLTIDAETLVAAVEGVYKVDLGETSTAETEAGEGTGAEK